MDFDTDPLTCVDCGIELDDGDNFEHEICSYCIEDLPNQTGYCSMSCRLGYGCDGSC